MSRSGSLAWTPRDMNGKCEDEKQKARQAKSLLQALLGGRAGGTVILKDPKRGKYAGRVISRVIVRGGPRCHHQNDQVRIWPDLMMAGSGRVGVRD